MTDASEKLQAAAVTTILPPVAPLAAPVAITPVIKPPLSYTQKVLIAVGISAAAVLLAILVYCTTEILVLCFAGLLFAVFLSAPADLLSAYTRIKRPYALAIVLLTLTGMVLGTGYFMGYTITRQTQQMAQTMNGAFKQIAADVQKKIMPARDLTAPAATLPSTEPATATAPAPASAPATAAGSVPPSIPPSASGPAVSQASAGAAPEAKPVADTWLADELTKLREGAADFFFSETFVRRAGGVAGGVVSSTFGVIGNMAVVLGVGLFFALNPKLYSVGLVKLVPMANRARASRILAEVGSQLEWWFVGQLCSMVSIALLTYIGLSILGIPMAITLAILAGLMNFIPNFGPLIAAAPAVLIAFAPDAGQTMLNPARAGWVILLYVIIQLLEGWIVTPFFQQRAVELPPALIIISQVVFALLLGPIGLILATPILAASIAIVRMVYIEDILGDRETPAKVT